MYFNGAFRVKMISLIFAIICTFTWHRRIAASEDSGLSPRAAKTAAVLSLPRWMGVGLKRTCYWVCVKLRSRASSSRNTRRLTGLVM
jgi:hypothetical protein